MSRTRRPSAPRQELRFIEFEDVGAFAPRAIRVPLDRKPTRVWTLFRFTRKDQPPTLPFVPQHRTNAWLEDYVHDWNIHAGLFCYGSRVTDEPVWILLEYDA